MSETPPRRILIHAGFHKTGTTTVQETLGMNAALLLPHVEMYLQQGALLSALTRAVLDFSGNRCKATKAVVTEHAKNFFAFIDLSDPRPVLVSSESLSGHFPGSSGVFKYGPAPVAAELIRDAWAEVTGSAKGLEFYYSTRRNGWLASCHWQRLKTNRSTLSLAEYRAKYASAADLDHAVDEVRVRLGDTPVHTAALEDMAHPVDPILGLLGLSALRKSLSIPDNANVFPGEEARDKLLTLNRANIWGDEFQRAKLAILRGG